MARIHFLNVGKGDCSIIEHGSGRVTMIDICSGNKDETVETEAARIFKALEPSCSPSGNYGMCRRPTNPITYIKQNRIKAPFRFILTHPDCDHLDGFDALCREFRIANFWDNGLRKEKPNFQGSPYKEEDWDRYLTVRDKKQDGLTVVKALAGSKFSFANEGDPEMHGDCIDIVAPDVSLVKSANESEDHNDGSYVLVYRSVGGKIVFGGDGHDLTWDYVVKNHSALVENCGVLVAPHHGRHSDRCHDFLDTLNPKLTLFGCADSDHLAYEPYLRRNLLKITNNQAGNIVLEPHSEGIDIYVQNKNFAQTFPAHDLTKTICGSYYIGMIAKPA
jgi:beta-lactamase superfamily II metal-dependent hydrolase